MEKRFSYYRQRTSLNHEELQEEDVWGVLDQRKDSDSRAMTSSDFDTNYRPPTAAITIPKSNKNLNSRECKIFQRSAPVDITDWSKINGATSKQNCEDEDEDEEGNAIPPHEMIARRLAKNRISSFSVCEGAGRTLKGRDLRIVRNAVLIKTGFLESKPGN